MAVYEYAFTQTNKSATADLTYGYALPLPFGTDGPSSEKYIGCQAVRLTATTTAASQTATIALILAEIGQTETKIAIFPATVSSTAYRTPSDGSAAGSYVATVAFTETGNSKLDLLGYGETIVPISGAPSTPTVGAQRGTKLVWYISCITLASGSMTVCVAPTRAI